MDIGDVLPFIALDFSEVASWAIGTANGFLACGTPEFYEQLAFLGLNLSSIGQQGGPAILVNLASDRLLMPCKDAARSVTAIL